MTIYDVSREAGVSIATVSRVMRDSGPVAASTRARVRDAMTALRFVPSPSARSLAEGRHAANGIVFPDLSGPYYADVLMGYEELAGELDRSVLLLTTHGRAAGEAKLRDLAARVDGLVVLGGAVPDALVTELAREVPVLVLAGPPVGDAHAVSAENVMSARALASHLVAHGHRRFAFIGDVDASADAGERWSGLAEGLASAGLPAPAAMPCAFDEGAGAAVASALLRGGPPPDVLACANDEIALGALAAARDAGLSVPGDLAVTGWDDVMAARYAGLTTVRQPMRALGALAARRLDDLIRERQGASDGPGRVPLREVLPTELVVRATCGSHTDVDVPDRRKS